MSEDKNKNRIRVTISEVFESIREYQNKFVKLVYELMKQYEVFLKIREEISKERSEPEWRPDHLQIMTIEESLVRGRKKRR